MEHPQLLMWIVMINWKYFSEHNNIQLANNELELQEKLSFWDNHESSETIGTHASDELLLKISSFLESINT